MSLALVWEFLSSKVGHYAIIAVLALAAVFGIYRAGYNSAMNSVQIAQLKADKAEAEKNLALTREAKEKSDKVLAETNKVNSDLKAKSQQLEDEINANNQASDAKRLAYNESPLVKNGTCQSIPSGDYTDDELKQLLRPPERPRSQPNVRRR